MMRSLGNHERLTVYNPESTQSIFVIFCSALIFFAVQLFINAHDFRGDARLYWSLSSDILSLDFPASFRGYAYPLLLSPFRLVYDFSSPLGLFTLKLGQALVYGYTFSTLLPNVFSNLFEARISGSKRIFISALIAVIFPGLVSYPLSDAPAFALTLASIAMVTTSTRVESTLRKTLIIGLAGALAYLAYNTRTIYVFAFITTGATIAFCVNERLISRLFLVVAFLLGAVLAAIPQSVINYKSYATYSPLVITDSNGKSLFTSQLAWGMIVDKYETYTEPGKERGTPVFYPNPRGAALLRDVGGFNEIQSLQDILTIMRENPAVFVEIYIRHIASGLDARDGDVYTTTPSYQKNASALVFLSIVIFGLVRLFSMLPLIRKTKQPILGLFSLAIMTVPCLAIIPGAIETRFFFPIYCLAYCAATVDSKRLPIRKTQVLAGIILVASIFLFTLQAAKNPIYDRPENYLVEPPQPAS